MSFRLKTILGVALIEAFLLAILLFSGLRLVYQLGSEGIEKQANTAASLAVAMVRDAVLARDIAALEDFVEVVAATPDVAYARIRVGEAIVAQAGARDRVEPPFQPDRRFDDVDDTIFDVGADVTVAGTAYGRVELGISTMPFQVMLRQAYQGGLGIAAVELVLVATFSFLLGIFLTRQLTELQKGAERVAFGQYGYHLPVRGNDELAKTAAAFNHMSTEISKTYRQIEDSTTRYKATLETAVDGIVVFNEQGVIQLANKAAGSIFGYDASEMAGRPLHLLVAAPELERLHLVPDPSVSVDGDYVLQREALGERRDGSSFQVEISVGSMHLNDTVLYNAILRDISDRVRQRAQIERFSTELRTIFDLSPDGFIAFNQEGIKTYANPVFLAMFNLKTALLDGLNVGEMDALMGDCSDPVRHYIPVQLTERAEEEVIYLVRPRPLILKRLIRRLVTSSGELLGLVLYFRDITQEFEVSRMKGEFLSMAAHELRTPLASIHGFSELLLHREYEASKRKDMLEIIHRQSALLVHLVNELLDLARIESRSGKDFHIQSEDMTVLVRDIVTSFQPAPGGLHTIECHLPEASCPPQ